MNKPRAAGVPCRPGGYRRISSTALTLLVLVVLPGCDRDQEELAARAEPGPVPEAPQRSGDPARGYAEIVDGDYMTCGMPYQAWRRIAGEQDDAPRLGGRAARNAGLPYSLSRHADPDGTEIVTNNCLLCHAAEFDGQLVIGLGNEWLDFTADPRRFVDALGAYVAGDRQAAAWQKWAARINAIAPYMITDTVGVNPAPNLTLALIAHRDPDSLAWSEEPLIEPPPENPLPASVPPWWRIGKKHALFYNAMGRGDHARFMMMKSLVCSDGVDEAESIDARFVHVRAFLASLRPPAYPFAIDAALAARGERLFERHCGACHGSYGPEGDYPNLVVDLETVGTDPEYARQAFAEAGRFMDWFNRSWYGEIAAARPAPGYIAPPLDGVWATAPFLHNGSVPTIAALLDSRTRPTYWRRDFDAREFDRKALGWKYAEFQHGKQSIDDPQLRKQVYDTTLPGYSNRGHLFGDVLSAAERDAILEYLKTL